MPATGSVLRNPAAPPLPTQAGIAPNCVSWTQALGERDTCSWLADRAGALLGDLYRYNPVLGAAGERCPEQLLSDHWYCVGTSSPPGEHGMQILTVIPSTVASAVGDADPASPSTPATTTIATSSVPDPEPPHSPDDAASAQDIPAGPSPALTPTPRDLPPTAAPLRTRISTITVEPAAGRGGGAGARVAEPGESSSEDEGEGFGKREEQPPPPATVTKVVTLVRRNRAMGRYQE